MSLSSSDPSHLILPLFEGLFETPLWGRFLHGLHRRTGAQRVCVLIGDAVSAAPPTLLRHVARDSDAVRDDDDRRALEALSPSSLRPNRIYALEELLDFGDTARRAAQDAALAQAGVGDGRFMRVTARTGATMQLALLHARGVFEAADSAMLATLAPAISAALDLRDKVARLQMRTAAAEDGLALLGIGQAVLDAQGSLIVSDAQASTLASALFGPEGQRRPADEALRQASAALCEADLSERRLVRADATGAHYALLRPMPPGSGSEMHHAAAIAAVRVDRNSDDQQAARTLQAGTDLSSKEAALAIAICRGQSVADAAHALGLTLETARNYTKRIYSKLALTGQADLVRYVLTSLAPLA